MSPSQVRDPLALESVSVKSGYTVDIPWECKQDQYHYAVSAEY
jgi:hypothetical protein